MAQYPQMFVYPCFVSADATGTTTVPVHANANSSIYSLAGGGITMQTASTQASAATMQAAASRLESN